MFPTCMWHIALTPPPLNYAPTDSITVLVAACAQDGVTPASSIVSAPHRVHTASAQHTHTHTHTHTHAHTITHAHSHTPLPHASPSPPPPQLPCALSQLQLPHRLAPWPLHSRTQVFTVTHRYPMSEACACMHHVVNNAHTCVSGGRMHCVRMHCVRILHLCAGMRALVFLVGDVRELWPLPVALLLLYVSMCLCVHRHACSGAHSKVEPCTAWPVSKMQWWRCAGGVSGAFSAYALALASTHRRGVV